MDTRASSRSTMSLDKSLKTKAALTRHRNVLTRAERIEKLTEEARWQDGQSPFGLPKIAHRKGSAGTKAKKAKKEEEKGEEGKEEKKAD